MIDRGISENYIIYWMDVAAGADTVPIEHFDSKLSIARRRARRGGRQSLNDFYDSAYAYFNGNQTLAAEYLRRALQELADPTPVDDSLPPPDSQVWEHVRSALGYFPGFAHPPSTPPLRSTHPQRSSR